MWDPSSHVENSRKEQQNALCVTEKLAIPEHTAKDLPNKGSEIMAKCRHPFKNQLENNDSKDWRHDDNGDR